MALGSSSDTEHKVVKTRLARGQALPVMRSISDEPIAALEQEYCRAPIAARIIDCLFQMQNSPAQSEDLKEHYDAGSNESAQ